MATTQAPIVPPRPVKSQDTPKVPARPVRRGVDRTTSSDRFAPSPLDSLLSKSPNKASFTGSESLLPDTPSVDRINSVDLPSVGQEGTEYAAIAGSLSQDESRFASPEHTRTVGDDVKLHAPKPALSAAGAKERVATVTRTDSDKAASYGFGRPSAAPSTAESATPSLNKKPSSLSHEITEDGLDDDKIPAIGRQVPMYPNAGDVQAPTPAELAEAAAAEEKNHKRKKSARGYSDLPSDCYGLHGHGVVPSDKLDREYYNKHPELVKKEHTPHHADRARDDSLPSDHLNKLVHETARTAFSAHDSEGTPSEQVGWQAIDESASRPASAAPKRKTSQSSASASKNPEISLTSPADEADDGVLHVDDPTSHRKSVMFSAEDLADQEYVDEAPILAFDEVSKDPSAYDHEPAVSPPLERRGSAFGGDPNSRTASRPSSIYRGANSDEKADTANKTDEYEHEPLFTDNDTAKTSKAYTADDAHAPRFPSRDVWEDAPSSAHYTAEVNTPDMVSRPEGDIEGTVVRRSSADAPSRDSETPAQAFARHQEELAEKELHGTDTFAENRANKVRGSAPSSPEASFSKPVPAAAVVPAIVAIRRPGANRFPSRDVWEDAPESLQLQTEVSGPQTEETQSPADAAKPEIPARPAMPSRPKPKAAAGAATSPVAAGEAPAVPERPKTRPVRQHLPVNTEQPEAESEPSSSAAPAPKSKPAVPARPFGGKIAALQASFMSDLNKKLKIGPQAPKKEEPEPSSAEAAPAAEEAEKVERAPLTDARKGRARGPQRRAPAARPAAAAEPASVEAKAPVSLGFSTVTKVFSIDPVEGSLIVPSPAAEPVLVKEVMAVEEPKAEEPAEKADEPTETEEPVAETTVEAESAEVEPKTETAAEVEAEAEPQAVAEVEAKPAATTASVTDEAPIAESSTTKVDTEPVTKPTA